MTAVSSEGVPPSAKVSVAMSLCGAPPEGAGREHQDEIEYQQFLPMDGGGLAMRAVLVPASTLTVTKSPI